MFSYSPDKISCFDNDALYNIARRYNNIYPRDKINIPNKITNKNRETFWNNLNSKINKQTGCEDEVCRIKNIIEEEKYKEFLNLNIQKVGLKTKNQWLNTMDINIVMKQYEKNSNYKFMGASL